MKLNSYITFKAFTILISILLQTTPTIAEPTTAPSKYLGKMHINRKSFLLINNKFILDNVSSDGIYGRHFEGDILLNVDQFKEFAPSTSNNSEEARLIFGGLFRTKDYRWLNKTIPIQISSEHSLWELFKISFILTEIESMSCLSFVPYTNQHDYITITVS